MKAVILSAGFGSRLAPLTDIIPKPMFPVLDRSILSLIIDNLSMLGIWDIGINLYHMSDKLGAHILRIRRPGMNFFTVRERILMGTGGGVAGFRSFAGGDQLLIHNCDVVTDAPLYEMLDFHNTHDGLVTLFLLDRPEINTVTVDDLGNVCDITDKMGASGRRLTLSGIWVMSPELFDYFPYGEPFSIVDIFLRLLYERPGSIKAWTPKQIFYWRDIGSVSSYLGLHRDILKERTFEHLSLNIPNDSFFSGLDVFVHGTAKLDGFVSAGHYVRIPKLANIRDAVIWPGTELPIAFKGDNVVIYKDVVV